MKLWWPGGKDLLVCLFAGFFCLFVSNQELNIFSTNTPKLLNSLMPLKRHLEFFHLLKSVACWYLLEKTEVLLYTALRSMQKIRLCIFLQISLESSVTKTCPGKCQHVWHRNAHAQLLILHFNDYAQLCSPELLLWQRRVDYWRSNHSRDSCLHSLFLSISQCSSYKQISALGRIQGDSSFLASDDHISLTAGKKTNQKSQRTKTVAIPTSEKSMAISY